MGSPEDDSTYSTIYLSLEIIFTLFTSSYYLFRFGRIGIGG